LPVRLLWAAAADLSAFAEPRPIGDALRRNPACFTFGVVMHDIPGRPARRMSPLGRTRAEQEKILRDHGHPSLMVAYKCALGLPLTFDATNLSIDAMIKAILDADFGTDGQSSS
jgi:hypothetical protein